MRPRCPTDGSIISTLPFLGRDLTYVFAGAVVIWSIEKAFTFTNLIPTTFHTSAAIYFIAVAYFLGLAVSEALRVFGWPIKDVGLGSNHLTEWNKIVRHYSSLTLIQHERTVFLMHVGCSLGGALLVSSIVLILNYSGKSDVAGNPISNCLLGIVAGVFSMLATRYAWCKARQAKKELVDLQKGVPLAANASHASD